MSKQTFEVEIGDVFRMTYDGEPSKEAWSDMIVTRVNKDNRVACLARPYAYADPISFRVVLSFEPLDLMTFDSLHDHYIRVGRDRVLDNAFEAYERGVRDTLAKQTPDTPERPGETLLGRRANKRRVR